jgi:hypothetical protein
MKKTFNKKIIFGIAVLVISLAAWAATQVYKPGSLAGVDKSKNITLVRKQKLMFPTETIGSIMFLQNECVTGKVGYLKTVEKRDYVPTADEVLTPAQIEANFNITIEEYFQSTDYARVESGRAILGNADNIFVSMKNGDMPSAWNCAFKPYEYTNIDIWRKDKRIGVSSAYDDYPGSVEVNHIRKEFQQTSTSWIPKGLLNTEYVVAGSNYKCRAHADPVGCYYSEMPVHQGTQKPVQLELRKPVAGSKFEPKLEPERDKFFAPYPGTMRGGKKPVIEEFVSMKVGEPISADKFEIPAFAKGYPLKETR